MSINKRTLAIFFGSTFIPASILMGSATIGIVKAMNPDNIDVTQGLAYLGYGIVPAVLTIIIWIGLTILLSTMLRKQNGNWRSAKLPLTLLITNLFLGIAILGFRELSGIAEDNWSTANGQQTRQEKSQQLDDFFDAVENDKN
jgi:hypothetical protein